MSVRLQITLPDDLAMELKRAAAKEKVPLARFVRTIMAERFSRRNPAAGSDPFASITDLVGKADVDLAARVDEILYK